jgi:hypothetical protein
MRPGRYACPAFFNLFSVKIGFFRRETGICPEKTNEQLKGVFL